MSDEYKPPVAGCYEKPKSDDDIISEIVDISSGYELKKAAFKHLVDEHDLTYEYADGDEAFRRGSREYRAIMAASKELLPEDARRIWNENADRKLTPDAAKRFYWVLLEGVKNES